MNTIALTIAALVTATAPPEVQRPASLEGESTERTAPEAEAIEAEPAEGEEPAVEGEGEGEGESAEPIEGEAVAAEQPASEEKSADSGEVFHVAAGSDKKGPPFYDESDSSTLRRRYKLEEHPPENRAPARWRCLIADPTCGINFEVNAMGAYAYRGRQGDTRREGEDPRWHSGRAQYDLWVNFPVMVETRGKARYTRMTLGPKGGVAFSDSGSLWGNLGMAARYWLGRGRWSPTIEFTSALSFKLGSRPTQDLGGADPKFQMTRGPVGFTADIGFGLGGFGAIVVGGQYDSPMAREEVPEQFRVSAAGTFFVGFRGNILWGGPAAAAILTHGLTQRYAKEP